MATTSLQRRVRLGGRLRLGRGLRARSILRVGPHALAKGMLEGLPYVAILLLLLLLLLVLFLILLFIFLFLLCASRLSTRQSKVDGTLVACDVHPGQSADDPLYLPLIERVRAILGRTGLLYTTPVNARWPLWRRGR